MCSSCCKMSRVKIDKKKPAGNDLAAQLKDFAAHRKNAFLTSNVFKDRLREVFADADNDNDGWVSHDEVFTMVLQLYLFIAQFTTINKLLVPTRARVEELYDVMDADGNGVLDFDEFKAMAIVLVEDMAARVGTQMVIKGILGPISGWVLVEVIHTFLIFAGIDVHYRLATILPDWIFSEAVALTVCTAISSTCLLPYLVNLIDRVMYVQAKIGVQSGITRRAREASIGGSGDQTKPGKHPLTHSPPKTIMHMDGSTGVIDYDKINYASTTRKGRTSGSKKS